VELVFCSILDEVEGKLNSAEKTCFNGANVNVILRHFIKAVNGERSFFAWDGEALLSEQYEDHLAREFVYYPGSFSPWP
jgi:hypothetical protein